jgi:hypothetical protein
VWNSTAPQPRQGINDIGPRYGRPPYPPTLESAAAKPWRSSFTEVFMAIEERVIASWKYKKGVLDPKTASLCYLAANLAAGNTH